MMFLKLFRDSRSVVVLFAKKVTNLRSLSLVFSDNSKGQNVINELIYSFIYLFNYKA